jgi:hypothetical protein
MELRDSRVPFGADLGQDLPIQALVLDGGRVFEVCLLRQIRHAPDG